MPNPNLPPPLGRPTHGFEASLLYKIQVSCPPICLMFGCSELKIDTLKKLTILPDLEPGLVVPFLVELVDEPVFVVTPRESTVATVRKLVVSFSSREKTCAGGGKNNEDVLVRRSEIRIFFLFLQSNK